MISLPYDGTGPKSQIPNGLRTQKQGTNMAYASVIMGKDTT